jgi:hypothetical protein
MPPFISVLSYLVAMMSPVSESAPQGAIAKEEILLRRYLDRTVKKFESVMDAKDEFSQAFRISEAIRMTARAIERMKLRLSIKDSEPFLTRTNEERDSYFASEYYLMLDIGELKVRVITRKNGKVLHANDWRLSDRYNFVPSIKVTMITSGRLSAFLRMVAEELRKRNQDERADQLSRLVEAVEKVMEHMGGGKEP